MRALSRVITDDARTVDDLVELLGVDRGKVRVIPLGVAEEFLKPVQPHVGRRPYLLYVGNHREHKDLATLFAAWSALPDEWHVDLYVTGPDDFGGELQRRSGLSRAIVPLGDVSAERLIEYYAGARALVQPALREGFGLPMLEAMAAGCPVVACRDAVPEAARRGGPDLSGARRLGFAPVTGARARRRGTPRAVAQLGKGSGATAQLGSLRARDRRRLSRGLGARMKRALALLALVLLGAQPKPITRHHQW